MSFTIEYFMWPFQHHFKLHADIEFAQLIRRMHPTLSSRLFLIGFLIENIPGRHPICIEPEDFELQPSYFENVPAVAEQLGKYDISKHLIHSHPRAQEQNVRRIQLSGWQQALRQAIESNCEDEWVTYVSWPVELEGFRVFTVAQLNRSGVQQFYQLQKSSAPDNSMTSFNIKTSLIEALTFSFLGKCQENLSAPNPGEGFQVIGDADELIRSSGKQMMDAPAIAGGNFHGFNGQFDICNSISTLTYEGSEGTGNILYIDREHPNLIVDFMLRNEVSLRNYGAVRKLLELSNDETSLLCDSHTIFGLGSLSCDYAQSREDAFTVSFKNRFSWQLIHADNVMMHVAHGRPELQPSKFPTELFRDHLTRIFSDLSIVQIQKFLRLATCLGRQNHGAMLVIAADAESESVRLQRQCTPIEPIQLTETHLNVFSNIDGAVLIDTNGVCHAIGVILDGLSHEKCTPARGSRFNSAIRYVYGQKQRLAIVKSDDGMIDILPFLMPRISKHTLEQYVTSIREMAAKEDGYVDRADYYDAMKWLDNHRFYLSAVLCDELNDICPAAEKKLEDQTFLVKYSRFVPNDECNDSYFH